MTNLQKLHRFCALPAAALLLACPPADAAAGWTSAPGAVGLGAKGGGETIGFRCASAGSVRMVLFGFDAGLLQAGMDYTVVVTVDGTAYRRILRASTGAKGERDLAQTAPAAELGGLLDALASGAKAEIASPAGREPLSLKGSGKALKAFRAGCS